MEKRVRTEKGKSQENGGSVGWEHKTEEKSVRQTKLNIYSIMLLFL